MNRRRFLIGLAASALGAGVYMRYLEPRWLTIRRHQVSLWGTGSPVRVLHLSDFHASRHVPLSFISRAIELGVSLKPDLVCLTGDFITTTWTAVDEYSGLLSRLSAAAPVYACLGNHDGGDWAQTHGGYGDTRVVAAMLRQSRTTLLENESVSVQERGHVMQLVGLGDLWAGRLDPEKAFASASRSGEPRVVLSHNPDSKDNLQPYRWNLMLSGHTHGGQLRVPWVGTPFAPVRDHRFVDGLHEWDGRWLHITKGVGSLHGLRLNCRPEISLITLT